MAEIYNYQTGDVICEGLQSHTVCDEAMQAALGIAADRGEPVVLDDGEEWIVHPDGTREDFLVADEDVNLLDD